MPFNPSLPAANSSVRSAELRDQFNALKELIDELPAGVTQEQLTDAVNSLQASINESFATVQQDLETTASNLTTEIETVRTASANNVDGINILDLGVSNPPTQQDVQSIVDKLNELINGLHR